MLLKKFIVFLLFVPVVALSQQAQIDLRHRPPEMIIPDGLSCPTTQPPCMASLIFSEAQFAASCNV